MEAKPIALTLPQVGDPVRYYRNGWHFGHVLEVDVRGNKVALPHPRARLLKRVKKLWVNLNAIEKATV